MKYYKVVAKCGHVGRNNYILKTFYVHALDGRMAASIVRKKGRVKHTQKDAIRMVKQISYLDYLKGLEENASDPFLNVHNIRDQRLNCTFREGEIIKEPKPTSFKKKTGVKQRLIESLLVKEWKTVGVLAYE